METIPTLIKRGFYIEAFLRFGGTQTVIEAHCPITKIKYSGIGDDFDAALADLNSLLEHVL